jgi:membrane-bound serine protease (ClpP class)
LLARLVLRSSLWKPVVGREALVGAVGEATETIEKQGMVFVQGELWRAVRAETGGPREPIPKGARVRVVKVEGLTLYVEPSDGSAPQAERS